MELSLPQRRWKGLTTVNPTGERDPAKMLYAALTFWLLVTVLIAWGVHRVWSGMIKAKVFNAMLLPGTLLAQIGHVVGMLITGGTISNTTLFEDDESGDPKQTPNPEPRIPLVGPVIIGMLPMLTCGAGIFLLIRRYVPGVLSQLKTTAVGPALPTSLPAFWQFLRDQVSLVEAFVNSACMADFTSPHTWVFFYLLICFSVRIAPFPGNLRGSLAAIVILGIGASLAASLFDVADPRVRNAWAVLNITVAALIVMLVSSLLIRGLVGLLQIIRNDEPAPARA
ncbi:MAG: hypothetical protein ACYTHJ_08655 [Planctomycetota bacterium]|jgi:hypothetical protein